MEKYFEFYDKTTWFLTHRGKVNNVKERLLNKNKYFVKKHFRFPKQILQFKIINNNNKKKKNFEWKKKDWNINIICREKKKENNGNVNVL